VTVSVEPLPPREPPEPPDTEAASIASEEGISRTKAVGFGVVTILLGLVALVAFGLGSESGLDSTFVFSPRGESVIDLSVPARATALVLSAAILVLGVFQIARRSTRLTYLLFGIALLLFVAALLTWAARDGSVSVFGLLSGTIRRAIPIALGAMAGLLCERAGIVNIAIEGMLLVGAFTGALVGSAADSSWLGLLGGGASGALLGLLLAVLSIRYRADQIIGGTVLNIFALGITSFLTARVLVEYPDLNRPPSFSAVEIPLLVEIPVIGPLLFDNTIYVYLMFGLVALLTWALFRTRWGLRLRAVGEHPKAADTVGIRVVATRYRAVVLGGVVAGVAGTFFTLDATGGFDENMTAGRGFIALAALIFGRWHPVGALCAALVFGFAEELQDRLSLLDTPLPSQVLLMTPYVVTIVVVAGLIGRTGPPAADGKPYELE
jgi:ABC-type uncharacterized transport system permease subunit